MIIIIYYTQSNAWDWDRKFVSMLRRFQFVSISGSLFISYKLKHRKLAQYSAIYGNTLGQFLWFVGQVFDNV